MRLLPSVGGIATPWLHAAQRLVVFELAAAGAVSAGEERDSEEADGLAGDLFEAMGRVSWSGGCSRRPRCQQRAAIVLRCRALSRSHGRTIASGVGTTVNAGRLANRHHTHGDDGPRKETRVDGGAWMVLLCSPPLLSTFRHPSRGWRPRRRRQPQQRECQQGRVRTPW